MIQSIKKHQFLLEELVKRDFKRKYKGAMFGMAWSIFNPLLMLLIMKVVFSHFFAGDIEHYTTYLFCGNIIFTFFSESTSEGMLALQGNAEIFTKVNVPKYLFLISKNTQTFLNFALTVLVFFVLCLFDGITFSFRFLLLLYPILMLLIFNMGAGLILSALYVFFRDMRYLWTVAMQIIMYVSAVFYSVDTFPEYAQKLFYLNPLFLFITYFRKIVLDNTVPSFGFHLIIAFYSLLALVIGILIYKKNDTEFLYYV